jgi:hypothetical protein
VKRVKELVSLCYRMEIDVQVAVNYLELVLRNAVFFKAWFSKSSNPMEFPVMPRTFDIITIDHPTPKWTTNMVANV